MTFDEGIQVLTTLRWPLAFVLAFCIGMLIFRDAVGGLVRGLRNRAMTFGGAELAAEQAHLPGPGSLPARNDDVLLTVATQTDNPWLNERKGVLEERLGALGLQDDRQKCNWLIRELALAHIANEFETLYRIIFTSQIAALLAANRALNTGVEEPSLRGLFDRKASERADFYTELGVSFDQWLSFLLSQQLLRTDDNGVTFKVTVRGQSFLHFLIARGYGDRADNDL